MLSVDHLTVRFGATTAVDDVSLRLDAGAVLAVLGPSGCGKSTLLRTVAGLEPAYDGVVAFDDQDLAGVATHKRGFALMFQDGQLFAQHTVARNVAYPLRLRRTPKARVAERVAELLDLVGLSGYDDRLPATLSGGERQRVALARALAVEPRLLLLDEPLSALDASLRERLAGDLREILRSAGTTALLVTHDQEEAFAVADRMAVMRSGRLVQEGSVEEVWQHPVDAETAVFLGYHTVLTGAAAERLARAAGERDWPAVALRRSALRWDPEAPADPDGLPATVVAARRTPDQVRLRVEVSAPGLAGTWVEAVADPGVPVGVGSHGGVRVERTRLAVLRARDGDDPRESVIDDSLQSPG